MDSALEAGHWVGRVNVARQDTEGTAMERAVKALAAVALIATTSGMVVSESASGTAPDESLSPHLGVVSESLGISYDEAKWRESSTEALVPLTTAVNEDREHFAELHKTDAGGHWRGVIN